MAQDIADRCPDCQDNDQPCLACSGKGKDPDPRAQVTLRNLVEQELQTPPLPLFTTPAG